MNIVLIGLSGSGKTTLGKALAEHKNMEFIDLDAWIEAQAGRSIPELFREQGEDGFRVLETRAAVQASQRSNAVIATGGGIVLREESMAALKTTGTVALLDREPARIAEEMDWSSRPLLRGGPEALLNMAEERRPAYLEAAELIFPNNGTPEQGLAALAPALEQGFPQDGYAVIGDPIGHSLSPAVHGAVFRELGVQAAYGAIHAPRGELPWFLGRIPTLRLRGFNVTAPHKQAIIPYLSRISREAELCGAVNTVTVAPDGSLGGYNTDQEGLLLSLKRHGYPYRDRDLLILGTGGAASGIACKAALEGARRITVAGRRREPAEAIRDKTREAVPDANIQTIPLEPEPLAKQAGGCDLMICAIPPVGAGSIDTDFLRRTGRETLICDLSYRPAKTPILEAAEAQGLPILNGLEMLIYQAILADERYLGRELPKEALFEAILRANYGKEGIPS